MLVWKIQHNKKQEKRGNHMKFEVKVNGLEQIGFVKEVIISEATTGRRIDVIVAKH